MTVAGHARSNTRAAKSRRSTALFCTPRNVGFFCYVGNIACDISGVSTKAPCEVPAMHGRHVCKGIAGSVLHIFVLLSGMRTGLFRLCYARSMPLLFAPRSASRLWVCCSHFRDPLHVRGYAARIAAVRFTSVGMPRALLDRFTFRGSRRRSLAYASALSASRSSCLDFT